MENDNKLVELLGAIGVYLLAKLVDDPNVSDEMDTVMLKVLQGMENEHDTDKLTEMIMIVNVVESRKSVERVMEAVWRGDYEGTGNPQLDGLLSD